MADRSILRMMPLLAAAGIGLGAAGAFAGQAGSDDGPVRCEIEETAAGGMTTLEAVIHADRAVAGSYAFSVEGGGGSNSATINQGGDFEVEPDEPAVVGTVSLGNGVYDATLEVTVDGETLTCSERSGGAT